MELNWYVRDRWCPRDLGRMSEMVMELIDPSVPPSGTFCVECEAAGGWWLHLRRCAKCGHIGCCDSSPGQHATRHAAETGHRYLRSFEPGEDWFWDVETEAYYDGPRLADPQSRPADQPSPGPLDRLPENWRSELR